MEAETGCLLTGTSLQPASCSTPSIATVMPRQTSPGEPFGGASKKNSSTLQSEELVAFLESLIGRKHDDLQLSIQDFLAKQMKLLESRWQGDFDQLPMLNDKLHDHLEQIRLLNKNVQEHSDDLLEALHKVSSNSNAALPGGSNNAFAETLKVPNEHNPASSFISQDEDGNRSEAQSGNERIIQNGAYDYDVGHAQKEDKPISTLDCVLIDGDDEIVPSPKDNTNGASKRDINQDKQRRIAKNANEYGLSSQIKDYSVEGSQSDMRGTLTPGFSNLHFAGDLLQAFSGREAFDLRQAMRQCELPKHRGRSGTYEAEPARNSCLAQILQSIYFEYFVCFVILANSVFITYSTDYAVDHPSDQENVFIDTVETIFQVYYILEMLAKLQVHRLYFFWNKDYSWNILDFGLAISAVYDLVMTHWRWSWAEGSPGTNNGFSFVFFRLLRLVRLMKVMRIFRVMRFFNELHVLLKVVQTSLRPLFWCSLIFAVFIYMFAVICSQGTASYLAQEDTNEEKKAALLKYYGSVSASMLSLSKAITGGQDWGTLAEALRGAGPVYYTLYLMFVGFCYLALTNILTGLFVDRTFKTVADDHDGLALEKLHSDRGVVADLCRFYCAMTGMDMSADVSVNEETFLDFMRSPVMRARLAVLDLEVWDSSQFFRMLTSISHTDELNLKCWVTGCMQLRGLASRISVQAVHADLQRLKKRHKESSFSAAPSSKASYGPSKASYSSVL